MARIAGIELSDHLKVNYALTRIKGLGWTLSGKVMKEAKIADTKRISDLLPEEINKITSAIEKYLVEGDLLRQVRTNVTRLRTISSYRGVRHARGLPTRGQRTRHNARTKRGKRKTVGAFKKEVLTKMATAQKDK
ncbi:MAG: 30S ribosomal protein S13 [Candidatus Woesebacteria bacterium GW2011_GWA1_37_8]|uniref:Small ribosomal subunit protein uS13 n=2 Tax=Candidatus Woeseibacteriota TaxID=1752722 RepID=A0A0G0NP89_9BACT|nr:MAG: 30S ribosomal protein S13 [Microgenomates group bacterium GW2011_GWC1_37_12b]KKQ45862.1 MAG: 30S ribosomal protein S13 [Candidatus Woesebacteria bacterium GW2011_GWA1_37_8]KKQ87694.1 MAG: 30S ribosomal protein S13 [Candidatus Woesebacteria bacterium GW2011_GWB1_38_8b]